MFINSQYSSRTYLEFGGKVVQKKLIKVPATKIFVPHGGFDSQFSLFERDDCNRAVRVTNVDKHDISRFVFRKIGLGDTVTKCGCKVKMSKGGRLAK